ncbi:kynureninase [Meredithblackwellia eburnea MCA 4105]
MSGSQGPIDLKYARTTPSPNAEASPSTSRTLPRPNPSSFYGHPNKEVVGRGDERGDFGVRLARSLTASGAPSLNSLDYARYMDYQDRCQRFRYEFSIPTKASVWPEAYRLKMEKSKMPLSKEDEGDCVYLAGNSLGCMPKRLPERLVKELEVWRTKAVLAHVEHPLGHPWVNIDDLVTKTLADIVGAKQSEVACMGTLTANLHALFTSFYKPTPRRHKIMYEGKAFPSDAYAFASQVALHDYPPTSLLPIDPRPGEYNIRTEDIIKVIEEEGDSIAIICFGAIQYYSGQYFDIQTITAAGHAKGCIVAFDCAHAVGNVELKLHDWGVDFAAWCSYKYLNAGPGGIAGLYVHERHGDKQRLQGWWGHDRATRFAMPSTFSPMPGAAGWQFSNPSVIDVIALDTSLEQFRYASYILPSELAGGHISNRSPCMASLREKSIELTGYLELLLMEDPNFVPVTKFAALTADPADKKARFTIITPSNRQERGAQLSLLFHPEESMLPIFEFLREEGVLGDERKPGVIRFAPVPMYCSWMDCFKAAKALRGALQKYPEWVALSERREALAAQVREFDPRVDFSRELRTEEDDRAPVEGLRRNDGPAPALPSPATNAELSLDGLNLDSSLASANEDDLHALIADEETRQGGVRGPSNQGGPRKVSAEI